MIGGGIAGLSAATVLAEHGAHVHVLEREATWGGRARSWELPGGRTMSRGFHAFFRQYYTLRDVLRRIDPELSFLRDVGGYPVESREWESEDFTDLPTTPLANLAALVWKSPSFRLRDLRKVDGREALAACAAQQPDWVLLDLSLSDTDALAAAGQINRAHPRTRVVVVADDDNLLLREAARRAGACGYVLKDNLLEVKHLLTQKGE